MNNYSILTICAPLPYKEIDIFFKEEEQLDDFFEISKFFFVKGDNYTGAQIVKIRYILQF